MKKVKRMFLIVLLFATWSSVFAISKATLIHSTPLFLTAVRMLLAAFLLLGYLFFKKRSSFKLNKIQLVSVLILGVLNIYLVNFLEFWGLQYLPAAKVCFIYSLSPFFAALFSYFHFNEKMNPKKWLGMGVGFLGMLPVFYSKSNASLSTFFTFSLPEIAIAGAALFSVYSWVLLRMLVKENSLSPLMANGSSMLIGGLLALAHSLFADRWLPLPVASGSFLPFLGGAFLIILISNLLCYNLYGYLLKKYTATFMSFVGLLSPFFASLSEWLILGTKPSLTILSSTCIVILGLWIHYQEELKQGYILKKSSEIKT
ncbi:MAG: DMT family transporter [Parachlamydiales bacterium]|jgi:drug/metabolite transporter (DMT)-like permease